MEVPAETDPPPVEVFVRASLPPAPLRVLEVGAGRGELARALREAGYEVLAIDDDPRADGIDGVTPLGIAELDVEDPFDAVVACRSLHHIDGANTAIGGLARALAPGGRLIVEDFAWDLVDFSTASWLYAESVRLGEVDPSQDPVTFYEDWRRSHQRLLGWDQLRSVIDAVSEREVLIRVPYLADEYLGGDEHARRREREQLAAGRLHTGAFRYVGRRPT